MSRYGRREVQALGPEGPRDVGSIPAHISMTPNDYLIQRLTQCAQYTLAKEEKAEVKNGGLSSFILKRLTSKKFRKYKMDEECLERTKKAIDIAISDNKPVPIIYFQGGYKLWRLPTSPEADWAEFFNVSFVLEYIAPIAAVYKPGVALTYYVHTLLMEKHDNLATEDIDQYMRSLSHLFDIFRKTLPKNVTLSILRDADLYSREDYFKTLEEGAAKAKLDYETLPDPAKARMRRLAELNIKWDGKEDWTKLSEKEKEEKLYLGAIYEASAVNNLKKVQDMVKSEKNILIFTKPTKQMIGIGSSKTSIAKHWVGIGVLESEGGTFYDRILTPSQFESVKNEPHEVVSIDSIPLKNFNTVWVYPKRFSFAEQVKH